MSVMGTREVLRPGHGCLIAEDDEDHFAAQCVRLLREPVLRAKLSAQGRAYAQSWSAPALADRMLDFYGRAIANARVEHGGTPLPRAAVEPLAGAAAEEATTRVVAAEEQRSAVR
jgi:hypothetical protein